MNHAPDPHTGSDDTAAFQALMGEVMADAPRFGHRQHVQLSWLAVRRHGTADAVGLVSDGILRTATAAGAPGKFHVTLTRAWVELVGHHAAQDGAASGTANGVADSAEDFDRFAESHPELLDKDLLARHYRAETLAGDAARHTWVEPDLAPFPWQAGHTAHA